VMSVVARDGPFVILMKFYLLIDDILMYLELSKY